MRDQQAMTGPPSKIISTPLKIEHFEHNKVWKMTFLRQMGDLSSCSGEFFRGCRMVSLYTVHLKTCVF